MPEYGYAKAMIEMVNPVYCYTCKKWVDRHFVILCPDCYSRLPKGERDYHGKT
jgi:hypothetical protein